MTQVVDLYRGALQTLHYNRLIWGSSVGFLMSSVAKMAWCSWVMVDRPVTGCVLFKMIF